MATTDLAHQLLLTDPGTGETVTYGDLMAGLSGGDLSYRPFVRPAGFRDAIIALAEAVVMNREVTLCETSLSATELQNQGITAMDLVHIERQPGLSDPRRVLLELPAVVRNLRTRIGLFTSGSTGLPKKVVHGMGTLTRALRVSSRHAGDVWGFAYNPIHIAGVQVFLQAFANANPMVNLYRAGREEVLARITQHGITHLSATPTFYRILLPVEVPLSTVTSVSIGGERVDAPLVEALKRAFPRARIKNLYASTEAGTILVAEGDVFAIAPEHTGLVRVIEGCLHLHASLLGGFGGNQPGRDEWYDTGDVVEIVEREPLCFRIIGRDREWINVGGEKVSPGEVEAVLRSHAGVKEARVYGVPSSVVGKIICADVVVRDPKLTETDLRRFLADILASFKVPRLINLVTEIGLTWTGKAKRNE